MRPRGEIRLALAQAAAQATPENPVTYADLARAACVGYDAARATAYNMAASGELVAVGTRRVPGIKRPLRTYVHSSRAQVRRDPAVLQLAGALRGWVTNV